MWNTGWDSRSHQNAAILGQNKLGKFYVKLTVKGKVWHYTANIKFIICSYTFSFLKLIRFSQLSFAVCCIVDQCGAIPNCCVYT